MMQKDLENVTCKEVLKFKIRQSGGFSFHVLEGFCVSLCDAQIRTELEMNMTCNLREFKEFIDIEMIVILGQMDSPTEIFEHVFLVRFAFLTCCTPQRNM